jgi:glucosyl-3-phosphoglycerate synthase
MMSFVILQVVMKRLEQRHRLQLLSEVNTTMKLIQHERDQFHVELKDVGDVERPPIALIPEYQAAHPPRPRRAQQAARPAEAMRPEEAR